MLDYYSDCPTFSLAFSPLSTPTSLKLAVGSYIESSSPADGNHVTVVGSDRPHSSLEDDERDEQRNPFGSSHRVGTSSSSSLSGEGAAAFVPLARAPHPYPPSAIAFSPAQLSSSLQNSSVGTTGDSTREMVASSSEFLRLWDLQGNDGMQTSPRMGFVGDRSRQNAPSMTLVPRAVLANSKTEFSAPLTSFSWSTLEPTHIVTSSIDTTCTVWDIATSVPITQLIAHDREVYDVAWSPSTRDVFASVGADGSVRMFDLRALEHSTILYEATGASPSSSSSKNNGISPMTSSTSPAVPTPLLRLAFSPTAPTYLSVCHADSAEVQILDTRNPGTPAMEIRGHTASVNGMAWGGSTMSSRGESSGPGWLATCSDDSTLLLWDLSSNHPAPTPPSSSSSSRAVVPTTRVIRDPVLSYSAPSECNAVAFGGGGEWVAIGCGRLVRCLKV